ncbi:myosin-13-like [Dysidea avara]|uniref:myosin-13-like n=1 Tax=Dysidea avara TaxID=196820 RepID=UPI00332C98CD
MAIAPPMGGYEYQFVTPPPDWLICNICQYPSREPHLSVCCGNTFCKSCLEGAKKATVIADACPICRKKEEFGTISHQQANRIVRGLYVFCTNKERGCDWQGELNDVIKHTEYSDGCKFEKVTCSNDCGKCLQRQYLTSHVEYECVRRKVDCQYCHIKEEYQFIEGEHKEQCPKFPIACPNKCEADNICREDIDEHRKMCPLEKATCPNECGISVLRKSLTSHVEMECPNLKVKCQYCHIIGEQQFINGGHKELCPKFPIICPNECDVGSVPRDDVEEHMRVCPLELIQCEYHVVGCKERVARKNQKKHNKEMIEEHLSLTTHQLTNTQHNLATNKIEVDISRKELTTRVTQTGKDLATTTNTQIETVKTMDRLILRIQEIEKDLATNKKLTAAKLEQYEVELSQKLQQVDMKSAEQLAATKDNVTLKLQETKDAFKEGVAINKENLEATQQELAVTVQELTALQDDVTQTKQDVKQTGKQLEEMTKAYTAELAAVKKNLSHIQQDQGEKIEIIKGSLKVTEQELNAAKRSLQKSFEDEAHKAQNKIVSLTQKLMENKRELTQLIDQTKDNLATEFHQNLLATKNEMFQKNTTSQKELTLAIQKLTTAQEDATKREKNLIQRLTITQQETKKTKDELTQKLTNTERELYTTKQQLATTNQNLTKAEKEHTTLAANTDEALAKLETIFQAKITKIEGAAQKRITELETKLEQKTQQIELMISDPKIVWYNTINYQASKLSLRDQVVPVIVKMSEYAKIKRDGVNWYSNPFYTHDMGYKMCIRIDARGSLGCYPHLMKGPYDDQLRWPMTVQSEVKILNQIGDSEHHLSSNFSCFQKYHERVIVGERNQSNFWGCGNFISLKELEKVTATRMYLKDDSFFLQVNYKVD